MKGGLKRRGSKNVDPRDTPLQHLQRDVIVVVVIVVVDVAIVQVDVGVPRSRRRGRPVIVGLPAGRRIALSLGVAMLPSYVQNLCMTA